MKVLKFGGTSVGSAHNMRLVADILRANEEQCIVVLSAMSGTTNTLVNICELLGMNLHSNAINEVEKLKNHYLKTATDLLDNENLSLAENILTKEFDYLTQLCRLSSSTNSNKNKIIIRGEFITCQLFQLYLQKINTPPRLINALDFVKTNNNGHPDYPFIKYQLNNILGPFTDEKLFITQGFACSNSSGEISNLGRGGSDFTATIIGSSINASIVEIWTDIDGLHNNDPRFVDETYSINELSYEEAEELAYFGAKILHPTCIHPVKIKEIPLLLKNTFNPMAEGTLIHRASQQNGFKAIAAKDKITAINIKSGGMMMAYGFLRRVFSVFEEFKCPVDMITTSEIAVSITIEDHPQLNEILIELGHLGEVTIHKNQCILCVVGDFTHQSIGLLSKISHALNTTALRMISYGASQNNICLLIDSEDKIKALNQINEYLFIHKKELNYEYN